MYIVITVMFYGRDLLIIMKTIFISLKNKRTWHQAIRFPKKWYIPLDTIRDSGF